MALSYFARIVEERIREAQQAGAFDNLPGKGKPLVLEDLSAVPEDLRMAYHLLKNAHVLPPEAELQKEIHTLQDLLKYIEDDGEYPCQRGDQVDLRQAEHAQQRGEGDREQ